MTSHTSSQLLGKVPFRKPNQHHLPPLLPSPSFNSTEILSAPDPQPTTKRNSLISSDMSFYGNSFPRNCCSVSTVGSVADADLLHEGSRGYADVVSYSVEHQLPKLFNNMLEDLLRERPEKDVDAWITRWFEDAYERRQRKGQRRLAQQGAYRFCQRVMCDETDSNSGDTSFMHSPIVLTVPKVTSQTSPVLISRPIGNMTEGVVSARLRGDMDLMQCNFLRLSPQSVSESAPHGAIMSSSPSGLVQISDNSVLTSIIAQHSLPPTKESKQLSAGEGDNMVIRISRGMDCRVKPRIPHTVDVGGNDESLTPGSV